MNQTKRRDAPPSPATGDFVVLVLDDMGAASEPMLDELAGLMGGAPRLAQTADDAILDGAASQVVVLARDPEQSLAAALASGSDTAATLAQWLEQRQALIRRMRGARRRVTLLDASVFARADAEAWQALARRLGTDAVPPLHPVPPLRIPDPLFVVSAALQMERDPDLAAMANNLRVATLGNPPARPSTETVVALIQNWRKVEASVATLLENVSRQAADRASISESADGLRDETSLLRDNLVLGLQEIGRLRGDLQATAEASDALMGHAAGVQEALDAQAAALSAAEAARDAALTRVRELEAQLEQRARQHGAALGEARQSAQTLDQRALEVCELSELVSLLQENARLRLEDGAAHAQQEHGLLQEIAALKARAAEAVLLKATNEALEHRLAARAEAAAQRAALFGAQVLDDARALQGLRDARDALARQMAELETDRAAVAAAQAEARALRDERDGLARQFSELQSDRAAVAEALAEARQRLEAIGAQLNDEARDNSALKAELDKVFQSKSWRLTKPLRSARYRITPAPRTNRSGPTA